MFCLIAASLFCGKLLIYMILLVRSRCRIKNNTSVGIAGGGVIFIDVFLYLKKIVTLAPDLDESHTNYKVIITDIIYRRAVSEKPKTE